jgi:hypothetical protein
MAVMIYQLIYHSHFMAVGAGPSSTIRSIVRASQANNLRDGITGFLIFDKTSFVQVLEGEQSAVLEAYERISDDPRHAYLTVLDTRWVETRAFEGWAMGGHIASDDTLSAPRVVALALDLLALETERQSQRVVTA